ncbi:serpin family protein [Rhodopseudomonas palustris]|uniref:serpin family protein n=1 Tax=Rhodopseudomonas palustris TaxID=1076 RepID=UPI0021F3230F|nr:serpin family protein [Rhodopseudomonas palustris]UYO54603.1 hypothetical protein KQX61_04045 [Rhodopseudomonas palustris]
MRIGSYALTMLGTIWSIGPLPALGAAPHPTSERQLVTSVATAPRIAMQFAQAEAASTRAARVRAVTKNEAENESGVKPDGCGTPHEYERQDKPSGAARLNASFALDLLAGLSSKAENLSVSPFGVTAVLSTLDLGADATMRKAIAATLRVGSGPGRIEQLRREARLINLASQRDPRRFASYNGVFVDHRLPLKPGIADLAKSEADVDLRSIEFTSRSGIDEVNGLLAKKTGGRISSILDPGGAPLLVVANAFAFKDCWKTPFDKGATASKPFTRSDGSRVERPTMSVTSESIGYRSDGRYVTVELPYVDEEFALTLVLAQSAPGKVADFKEAAALLAGTDLADARVTLSLPKFGGSADNDLLDVLSAMGLKSGLASSNQLPGFADGLVLGRARQKIWLAVDEAGTQAAAITSVEATRNAERPKQVTANFDKPFIYALRHRPTGTILIAGYVGDPDEGKDEK